jgi:hypothetical protein
MPEGGHRFWGFFTVNIRNPNTRRSLISIRLQTRRGDCSFVLAVAIENSVEEPGPQSVSGQYFRNC